MHSIVEVIYSVVIPVFLIAGIGFWFSKHFNPSTASLTKAAIYIFLPCLIFQSITSSELAVGEIGQLSLLCLMLTGMLVTLGWFIARLHADLGGATQSAIMLSIVLVNSGNFGLPLVDFAFGASGSQRGVIIAVLMMVVTNTVGVYLASRGSASFGSAALTVLKIPLPYAVALGFLVRASQIALPLPVTRTISLLGQAAVPLLLVLLGVQLANVSLRSLERARLRALLLCVVCRLVIAPLLVAILTVLLDITGAAQRVAVVQLGLPTAVNASLLAAEFGSDTEFVSAAIMISTLASIASLSILLPLAIPG